MPPMAEPVLLVEDDANDVLLLQRAWRRVQIARPLQVVTDGEQGVAYLAGHAPYMDRARYPLPLLMLLDLCLPARDGFEVLAWLRQQPGLRRLPVVVLTSSRLQADINRAYELGANSYLTKPLRESVLDALVRMIHGYWLELNERPEIR